MKKIFIAIIIIIPALNLFAQEKGIHFEQVSGWQEILAKAKAENKYIFLDCYATWCGPCKYMAENVFTQNEAGDYFNAHFISAKVQMDRTKADAPEIKQWYGDAASLMAKYAVAAFPTYLFFSPDGTVLHRIVGTTKTAAAFIEKAKDAFEPSKQYYTAVAAYKQHLKDSAYLRNAIEVSLAGYDKATASEIGNYYFDVIKDPYAAANLRMIMEFTINSKDKGYPMFLKHPEKVDAILSEGSAASVVSNVMYKEDIKEYFETSKPAPDWTLLKQKMKKKYPIVPQQQVDVLEPVYYRIKRMIPEYERAEVAYVNRYYDEMGAYDLNDNAWRVFGNSNNPEVLKEALKWSKRSLDLVSREPGSDYVNYMDTYAQLLYKLGEKDEAIQWEKKLLEIAKNDNKTKIVKECSEALAKMEKGEKTWD